MLAGEERGVDEDGTQGAGMEVEIEFQFLVFVSGVGIGVDDAVHGLFLVVGGAVTLGFTEQLAGVAFLPVSDLLLAVGGDLAPNLQEGGRRLERGGGDDGQGKGPAEGGILDRKSTRLNSSHLGISYAVFC